MTWTLGTHTSAAPVTGPLAEPLTRTEAKKHLREDDDGQNTLIDALIIAARQYIEERTGLKLVTQSWAFRYDYGFCPSFRLPFWPLRSITSISYTDADGDAQTLATSVYTVDRYALPPRIFKAYNQDWPTTRGERNNVTVTGVYGYSTVLTSVDTGTDIITATGHPYATGDVVTLQNSGGALPTGLSVATNYYAIAVSGSTLQLSTTSGGSAVDITASGTGTSFLGETPQPLRAAMLLIVGHLFEHREQNIETALQSLPMGIDALVAPFALYRDTP